MFTTDGLLDYIIELVVCEDKVKFGPQYQNIALICISRH